MKKINWICGVTLLGITILGSGKVHAAENNSQNTDTKIAISSEAGNKQQSATSSSDFNTRDSITNATTEKSTNSSAQVINQNQVVRIQYSGKGQVAVWDNYQAPHSITKYLPKNTSWKSFKVATLDDKHQWYNLGGNQWVDSNYAVVQTRSSAMKVTKNQDAPNSTEKIQNATPENKVITINYSGKGKVAIWSNFDQNKKIKQYVAPNTNWVINKKATDINGKIWYDLGANQWLDSQYARDTNGIIYYSPLKANVFCRAGKIQSGKILNGKQTIYTHPNGAIYRVQMDVPVISQLPQLPTGCEMTAVTMMLQYAGVNINKLQVAAETPRANDGNHGFVGNPYSPSGWWVFPSGIAAVVNRHLGHSSNLTGASINTIKNKLLQGHPVVTWVANMNGFVNHALTLTGFSTNGIIYYNNPWTGKRESMSESNFLRHWNNDKRRALSY
ncbi:C39 family peptidase [Lactobacillus sp. PV034]|uniref:C39 family peptidase n=1 Tax=Lactobacillus sp. PV034 TaxID=2594495 RepID=UPI00223FB84B|nr:C39 family peptidase [Lactobacillus sp. PV034]QNQ80091.1 hypothetical protein FP432_00265 [Lactobacillus sp. PV034]